MLIDSGSLVTIVCAHLWGQIRDPRVTLRGEPVDFQGVTQDGLRIFGINQIHNHIGGLYDAHLVLIADEIAHKFILGNNS